MRPPPTLSTAPPWPGVLAYSLALAGGALALCAANDWTFGFAVGPLRVSMRNPANPAIGGVLCLAFSYWWLGAAGLRMLAQRMEEGLERRAPVVAAALALLVVAAAWHWGAFVAGGADSSGYLYEARLWQSGDLRVSPPRVDGIALESGVRAVMPIGFRLAGGGTEVAPTYPPGYPLVMAALTRIGGEGAQFLAVPIAAGLLTWTAFVLGRLAAGPLAGLFAAATTAASPTVVYQALQPMSDLPAACAWLIAIVAAARGTSRSDAIAAGAATAACLIRPNLFAMTPLLAFATAWWAPPSRRGFQRALALFTPIALAGLGLAWWQRRLYGGATETGYGAVNTLFSIANVPANLANYPSWLLDTHGYFLLLALPAPLLLARGGAAPSLPRDRAVRIAWWCMLMCAALFAFYALYLPFDSWSYTRFLLPALPLAFVLAATTVAALVAMVPQPLRTLVAICGLVLVPAVGWSRSREAQAFRLWDNERRFTEAASFVEAQSAPSVLLCMEHSGSLAYYTGRPLLRWDWLQPHEADRVIDELAAAGHTVYAVLDDWEIAAVQARFPGSALASSLHSPVFRSGERVAIVAFGFLVRPGTAVTGK